LDTLSSIPTLEEKSESTKIPYWLDLPGDLAANIFKRLDILTILTDVYALFMCPNIVTLIVRIWRRFVAMLLN
jgi:hypothetical protein